MDERDFAELISVFLKGSDSDEPNDNKEDQSVTMTQAPATDAEIRKNIIEALAEKIRESQEKTGLGETRETVFDETFAQEDLGEKIVESTTAVETKEAPEILDDEQSVRTTEPDSKAEIKSAAELITEEEVVRLLTTDESEKISPLQEILDNFLKLEGIVGALLVTRDGFTVEHVSTIDLNLDMISAIVATGFNSLDKIGSELNHGGLQIAMLEYLNGPIFLSPLVHDVVLIVIASEWATLGRIRWEIRKQSEELIVNL
jgi:uncharacterized protein